MFIMITTSVHFDLVCLLHHNGLRGSHYCHRSNALGFYSLLVYSEGKAQVTACFRSWLLGVTGVTGVTGVSFINCSLGIEWTNEWTTYFVKTCFGA